MAKLYWRKTEGGKEICFDNTPFSVDREVIMDCQYGPHYWKDKETKMKRLQLQGSRKLGCHAHIKIRYYTVYSDYQVCNTALMTKRQLRDCKENKLSQLRKEIGAGRVTAEEYCFIVLPTESAHSSHPTGEISGFSQRVHPLIIAKITELVVSGITNVHEVRKILRHYVQHNISVEHNLNPLPTDRAFYPMPCDIKNHICKTKKALELSKLDQENLRLKMKEWKQSSPSSNFYFRPYVKKDDNKGELDTAHSVACSTNTNTGLKHYVGNNGVDDDDDSELLGTTDACTQSFLWIHQEKWQRDLLVRFGNTITLIDATYKTTKYEIALFFLSIKTNVGYIVVAEFIVSSESAQEIAEALSVLKDWNPEWSPAFFMSDYSEAESVAIEEIFPAAILYICDFHREQAWERWTKDHKHGLSKDDGEKVLELLRDCAHAPAPTPDEKLPVDHYYQCALDRLKKSCVWKTHVQLQEWLTRK